MQTETRSGPGVGRPRMAELMTDLPVAANDPRAFYIPLAIRTVKNLRTCLQWAWLDIVCQYRRSRIGPLWETVNILVMVLGLSVVSSAVIGGDVTDLIGYIGLGVIIAICGTVGTSCSVPA
jgi:hypothetical protein